MKENTINSLLKRYYKFNQFRPGQEEIIQSILDGRDTLAVMPTGGGKSLCYQLPALILEGITLVISPLIALMKDQVDVLRKRKILASFINSSLTEKEVKKTIGEAINGKIKILYIAPERFNSDFSSILQEMPINFVAIDEAHCVSTWGHDFRPDYRVIKERIDSLPKRPIVAGFTATATPEVRDDIAERLGLKNPQIFIRGFDRPNLRFLTCGWMDEFSRDSEVLRLVKSLPKPGIVYVGKRDKAEELAAFLTGAGISALPYHAGLKTDDRTVIQEAFMKDKLSVIVATIAFGMGIDKSDVRFVIHAGMPGTLERYYQEAGRAGRDSKPATCVLLHSGADSALQNYFIRKSYEDSVERGKPEEEACRVRDLKYHKLKQVEKYVMANSCKRKIILDYFGDESSDKHDNCQGCDYCLGLRK
ncbi:MAG: RecQ family ATP-dependent DNA helicase [Candidatus Nealsonbacteria bacterium]|nr:RecQ family ATP-dependent DNA helicase [Candidatus Nealsonbacteria bacterium]